jgi:hypothetical protein
LALAYGRAKTPSRARALDPLSDEVRAALEDEARFLAVSIADETEHVENAVKRGEVASEILKAQLPRLQLAIQMWECVETGRLDVIARAFYLDEMVRLVEVGLDGELRELATTRDQLQEVIIRGPDPRDPESREENIAYCHRQIERAATLIRGQRAFLALAAAEKERVARFVAEEAAEDR